MSKQSTPEAGTTRRLTGSRSWRRIATLATGAIIALAGLGAECGAASASAGLRPGTRGAQQVGERKVGVAERGDVVLSYADAVCAG